MHRPRIFHLLTVPILALWVILGGASLSHAEGKPDLKTYPAPDFKDMAYMQKVHAKVGGTWKIPAEAPQQGGKAVVIATFLRDGSILETRLHHKSGSTPWDSAALEAVTASAPLEPLPRSYPRTSLEVHFHFEWN